jgi:hypothetical protein
MGKNKLTATGRSCYHESILCARLESESAMLVRSLQSTMRSKLVIFLTCLLLFVSAVDSIPDPPAINPPGVSSGRISTLHVSGSPSQLEKLWCIVSISLGNDHLDWLSSRFAVDNEIKLVIPLPLVRHAADSSPPSIS